MDMTGERRIAAPQTRVWAALNDPDILRAAIPGCDALDKVSDTAFTATVTTKLGPIKARFTGRVELTGIDAPNGCHIGGEGQGGVAGFAKGGADVRLARDGDGTLLVYAVHATVGGRIAQLGGRLIDSTARKLADQFFTTFDELVSGAGGSAAA